MKRNHLPIITLGIIILYAITALAATPDKKPATEAPKQLHPQTVCPVMGYNIDSTVFVDLQGQRVYFCCKGCPEKFKADPDTYFKKAAAEGVLFENIQTTCRVSGEKLKDKSVFADYEGRRIAFCCPKCIGDFGKDPQKYLTKMDAPAKDAGEKAPEKK